MPDLVEFSVTRISNASVSLPRWTIAGKLVDSKTQQTVIADFTGVNAVTFPTVLTTLTAAERDEMVQMIVMWLLQKKFPGAF